MKTTTKTIFAAAMLTTALFAGQAQAAVTFNGPELSGIDVRGGAPVEVIIHCDPWECGVNGRAMAGTIVLQPEVFAKKAMGSEGDFGMPNGPDLDGSFILQPEVFAKKAMGSEGDFGLPANGPDLDGSLILQPEVFAKKAMGSEGNFIVPNGPDLSGIVQDFGIGNCEPWQCGVNGPALSGTAVDLADAMAAAEAQTQDADAAQ